MRVNSVINSDYTKLNSSGLQKQYKVMFMGEETINYDNPTELEKSEIISKLPEMQKLGEVSDGEAYLALDGKHIIKKFFIDTESPEKKDKMN